MGAPWKIEIQKRYLKFSSAHMTIFPDGSKEPLHGHNYQTKITCELRDASFEKMISFAVYKQVLEQICESWDEKILIQEKNPFVMMDTEGESLKLTICGKKYEFPKDEVVVLPVENISAENLAEILAIRMARALIKSGHFDLQNPDSVLESLQLGVYETEGQGASFRLCRENIDQYMESLSKVED